jgi:hypothetical protein
MAYYLIHRDHGLNAKIHLVGSCIKEESKDRVLKTYCKNNDINLVKDRDTITEVARGHEIYTYQVTDNSYIILDCTEHEAGYIRSRYVEKYIIGWLEFLYYSDKDPSLKKIEDHINKNLYGR